MPDRARAVLVDNLRFHVGFQITTVGVGFQITTSSINVRAVIPILVILLRRSLRSLRIIIPQRKSKSGWLGDGERGAEVVDDVLLEHFQSWKEEFHDEHVVEPIDKQAGKLVALWVFEEKFAGFVLAFFS